MTKDDSVLLIAAQEIARRAGEEILIVYGQVGSINVEYKADNSPLTEADSRANAVIVQGLQALTPEIPVLSEESDSISWEQRKHWHTYWLVDPLDGTKEFISRNGEFTVNIALIRNGQPVLGVVHVPVQDICYSGLAGSGANRQTGSSAPISIRASVLNNRADKPLRVVASRRHGGEALEKLLTGLQETFAQVELVNMGSSLKICLLAEGKADLYPRLAPTSEWDTAAAHAVLLAAGGQIYRTDFTVLEYNRKDSVLNPFFIAVADAEAEWPQLLKL